MDKDARIYVAGHNGLVGSALLDALKAQGYKHIITRTRGQCDLRNRKDVEALYALERPDMVFVAAAKVGGIWANATQPADFILQNLQIQNNVIDCARRWGVKRLIFLGSSCIYPKHAEQPIKESALHSGYLEPTNRPYAVAKIAGIELCDSFNRQYGTQYMCAMPTNLYGPRDNYHLEHAHIIPAVIRKMHEAKISTSPCVTLWGTGNVKREFLYSEDLAHALLMLATLPDSLYTTLVGAHETLPLVNIGCGEDILIKDLALKIKKIVGYTGNIEWDTQKPDGTPRKCLDVNKIYALGWRPTVSLDVGLHRAYLAYQATLPSTVRA